mmetsp:Transcript_55093/g.103293  ORF Transcript_55093/g.103293 Transcript_55093/m.103293 type:complete len:562 (+) Transcript_55093:106-1791(+)
MSRLPILLCLSLSGLAIADLPVHCLHHEIVGNWKFSLGRLSNQRSSCGHQRPDAQDFQPRRELFGKVDRELIIALKDPNVAEASDHLPGTWTMIYDEGFEVEIGNHNFFAFSNFTFGNAADVKRPRSNMSHCDQTMVGWYRSSDRSQFGCYYASKVISEDQPRLVKKIKTDDVAVNAKPKTLLYQTKLSLHHQQKVVSKLAEKISNESLRWSARPMEKWNGLSMLQVNSYAGIKRQKSSGEMMRQHAASFQRVAGRVKQRSFLQTRVSTADMLPQSWDWSNVNGQNFLEPVMDQSECGSCYVASAMRMLTARHKITQNNTAALPWSINFPLQCSEYNQGCRGGYGILAAKWSQEVGLLPANCMRYSTEGSCELECDLKSLQGKRYRADNHRYVGAWYGEHGDKVNEIKAELFHKGPLILGIEPGEDFMWYSDGIYRSPSSANIVHPSSSSEWERVDHAVLLVGYGEEGGQKYWKLQNSWGEDWGENGFFRMVMGENDSGIESIPEAADVVEDEQNGKQVEDFFTQLRAGEGKSRAPVDDELALARKIESILESKLQAKSST